MAVADGAGGVGVVRGVLRQVVASANWLISFFPLVGPNALAATRIFIGVMIVATVSDWYDGDTLSSAMSNGGYYALNNNSLVLSLSNSALARDLIYSGVIISAATFALGALSRVSAVALAVFLWLFALCANFGHFMTPMLLALTATVPARWGESWSIDRLFQKLVLRKPITTVRSRLYGYPIWLCGLAIALAYTTAGLSKYWITDGAWLWDTGARWGFITDLNLAATEWALPIVNSYPLSLGASLFACLGQVIYVASCFTRSYWIKLALGVLVAIPFLIGLTLFMGLYWWPWATLVFVLYAPWQLFDGKNLPEAEQPMTAGTRQGQWAVLAAVTLLLSHSFVMVMKLEFEPLVSNYPMYALPFRQGTLAERTNWNQYKELNRHYRNQIVLVGANGGRQDASQDFATSEVINRARLPGVHLRASSLSPHSVWGAVDEGESIPDSACDDIRYAADILSRGAHVESVEFGRRFYDLDVDGNVFFIPPPQIVSVTFSSDTCAYTLRQTG